MYILIAIVILIIGSIPVLKEHNQAMHPNQKFLCTQTYSTITGIKQVSGGFFCKAIYTSDKGDISRDCGLRAGDKVYDPQECKWVPE